MSSIIIIFFSEMLIFQKDSDNDYKEFKVRTVDFEHRFANLLCLAFKDCSDLESVFKVSKITSCKCGLVFSGNPTSLFSLPASCSLSSGPSLREK